VLIYSLEVLSTGVPALSRVGGNPGDDIVQIENSAIQAKDGWQRVSWTWLSLGEGNFPPFTKFRWWGFIWLAEEKREEGGSGRDELTGKPSLPTAE
jgi:hypothetical protein